MFDITRNDKLRRLVVVVKYERFETIVSKEYSTKATRTGERRGGRSLDFSPYDAAGYFVASEANVTTVLAGDTRIIHTRLCSLSILRALHGQEVVPPVVFGTTRDDDDAEPAAFDLLLLLFGVI